MVTHTASRALLQCAMVTMWLDFRTGSRYCYQEICFGGFGKERGSSCWKEQKECRMER